MRIRQILNSFRFALKVILFSVATSHFSRSSKIQSHNYAVVNSSCTQHPHPIPPPRASPRALAFFFLPWMANSWGWGLFSCKIRRGGDEKRGQTPCPQSTLQQFSLIAQSNSTVLNILMCNFLFQVM